MIRRIMQIERKPSPITAAESSYFFSRKESSNSFKDGNQSVITLKFANTRVYLKNVGLRDSSELVSHSLLVLGIEEKLGM